MAHLLLHLPKERLPLKALHPRKAPHRRHLQPKAQLRRRELPRQRKGLPQPLKVPLLLPLLQRKVHHPRPKGQPRPLKVPHLQLQRRRTRRQRHQRKLRLHPSKHPRRNFARAAGGGHLTVRYPLVDVEVCGTSAWKTLKYGYVARSRAVHLDFAICAFPLVVIVIVLPSPRPLVVVSVARISHIHHSCTAKIRARRVMVQRGKGNYTRERRISRTRYFFTTVDVDSTCASWCLVSYPL